jgi:hypothetical protein
MGKPRTAKLLQFPKHRRAKTCLTCHRRLSDPQSRKRGYGPVCFAKRPSLGYAELESIGQLRFEI